MQLPKYHETFIPILDILQREGVLHHRELAVEVREKYYSHLSKELLEKKTSTGANALLDRIGWGKSYLKMGKFVNYPKRGVVEITEKGRKVLKTKSLTLEDLQQDPDFMAYRKDQNSKKNTNLIETTPQNASPQDLLDAGITQIEAQVKTELLEKLQNIDPYYFEIVILTLLKKMGYGEFVETAKSGDGGIDGIINEDALGLEKIYIQAKRYAENKVREKDIRNFIGAMSGDTTKGIFVTTSSFDEAAVTKAREAHHKIILLDGNQFVDLMYAHGVGLQIKNTYDVKEIDEDFFEGF
jgi:restriction system protein